VSRRYILNDHEPVPCDDLIGWAMWLEKANRIVGKDMVGEVRVSTVFLGLDHSFGQGPPMLFETMVFGGPLDSACERCSTWEQAEAQHSAMLKRVQEAR
jgi:hypothetical protein